MIEPTLKIGTIGYKLNPEKLKGASQSVLPYILGCFYFKEEYEYFDIVKPYLDIPPEPKTLEQIEEELNEKFEKLIEQYKRNSYASKLTSERNYEYKFDRIIGNFAYAKKYGSFPKVTFISSGTLDYSKLLVTGGGSNISSPSFVVKHGSSHQGYYMISDKEYDKRMREKAEKLKDKERRRKEYEKLKKEFEDTP